MPAASNALLIKSVLSNNCVSVFTSQRACIGFMTLNLRSISKLSSFLFFMLNFLVGTQKKACQFLEVMMILMPTFLSEIYTLFLFNIQNSSEVNI